MQMLIVLCLVVIGAIGTVLMKVGAEKVVYDRGAMGALYSAVANPHLVGGIALQLVPLLGWTILLKTMPLTKLQPMVALTYVVTPVLAVLLLGESLPSLRLAGIGLIVVGVILVSMS